jgi:3-oxoacyl-[acyl-carrier protein] reductase
VQVNAINPGYIRTDRLQSRIQKRVRESGEAIQQVEAKIVAEAGTVRIGEPDDIANLVAFLASSGARFLQGALIDADGGQTKTV